METKEVRSDMAGSVWRVERAVGDQVSAEEVIIILESMKMEIPVVAPVAGMLAELRVEPGTSVKAGTVLFAIES